MWFLSLRNGNGCLDASKISFASASECLNSGFQGGKSGLAAAILGGKPASAERGGKTPECLASAGIDTGG
jgi:hypothetical protein